jgi:hypothetical protein
MPKRSSDPDEFTARHLRRRSLLLGAGCGVIALFSASPVGAATVGAALALLGIAVFTWRSRRIGADLASAGLGLLAVSTGPALLVLLDSL